MSIKAASPVTPYWYKPNAAEEGDKTRFQIRGLTPLELFDVHAASETMEGQIKWTARAVLAALHSGLLAWDDFEDKDGQPVEFAKNMSANIERLGFHLTSELFMTIMTSSSISEEQRKN